MRKSTRAISLALVGSGLILTGCVSRAPPPDGDTAQATGRSGSGSHGRYYGGYGHGYGGGVVGPGWFGGGAGRNGAGGKGVSVSPRGGFGGAGHAAGGS